MVQAEGTTVNSEAQEFSIAPADYVQFGIPGVAYSAIRIHITDDHGERDIAIARALRLAKYVRDEFVKAFGPLAQIQEVAQSTQAGPPKCNVHNRAMKPSAKGGGFYCSAKLGDGTYCQERAA